MSSPPQSFDTTALTVILLLMIHLYVRVTVGWIAGLFNRQPTAPHARHKMLRLKT
jgi:hypothetical protein